ncbi:hypothetical protein AB3U43_02705 (plasmid) [Bacillus cereus]|uniref:Uncharacterized protein n=1 Tax=Bacillus thuringiensis serovar kumamotoensis TaxID=132267 RepID=A0A9X6PNE3_BACUK|nr:MULTISPECIES: hypothetical protein [Bacillus cereus group]MCU4980980.1 hypothetical protein [Bacillus cereus]MCU5668554.1 hypothetical protein [Bacillus cereus]MEC2872834.1 hypothetical protein [Bacillus cereus]OTZ67937.1 hypothetical protein BK769_28930 [Bacillus thuringiensis serovar kumamtoensis]TKH39798.1 hypothetical protein FC698_23370 [Bacillus cereus]
MLQIRTVIADALRIDEEVNGFLKYCANYEKIVKKITPSGFVEREQDQPLLVMVFEYEEKFNCSYEKDKD